jgi:hypothetical protein
MTDTDQWDKWDMRRAQLTEIERLVKETAIPKYDGWDEFFDFWANWTLSLPADLAKQVAGDLCSFIQVIRYHDRSLQQDDADLPGSKTLEEIEDLLRRRLRRLQQKVKRIAA